MRCQNCGAENNSKFCENCGSPIEQNQTTEPATGPTRNSTPTQGSYQQKEEYSVQVKSKKPIFKRWWFWLIIIVVIGAIAIGSGNKEPVKETDNNTSQSTSNEDTSNLTFGLDETAVFENIKVTASEVKESDGSTYNTPDDGMVFVGVKFTVENISDEDQAMSSLLLFDAYVDSVKCDYSFGAAVDFSGTIDGTISPGKKLVGWYAVEIPKDWEELELQVKSSWVDSSSAIFIFKNK